MLNNSGIWIDMTEESSTKLENLQNVMFRNLFGVPASTPIPLLMFDVGCLKMDELIYARTLLGPGES